MGISVKKTGQKSLHPDINITPFVDILLVLLIVFMVASPALVSGLSINLPKAQQSSDINIENKNITLTIDAQKMLYINDKPVEENIIISRLQQESANIDNTVIFIRGDSKLTYGDVMNIVNILAVNNYTKIVLVTEDA